MMNKISYHFGQFEDLEWLFEHDCHVDHDWIQRCIKHDEYIIALCDESKIGFLRYSYFWGKIPYMEMIWVEEKFRGKGIGRDLFKFWEHQMQAKGIKQLMTSAVSDELKPQLWHEKQGFKKCGEVAFGAFQSSSEQFFIKTI